jgi:hypothetical protein
MHDPIEDQERIEDEIDCRLAAQAHESIARRGADSPISLQNPGHSAS